MLARVMALIAEPGRMQRIGRAALELLLAVPDVDRDRLGAFGYGAGGSIVPRLATARVPFKAVVAVHPALLTARAEDWVNVAGSFLLYTGSEDPLCTPDQTLAFTRALQEAGMDWRVHVYSGAEHANQSRWLCHPRDEPRQCYCAWRELPRPAHTARAWRAVLDLFGESTGISSDAA
jgi:dienelactone hydrolase